ncbi:ribosomal L7Ae/L30e/S12e/Gadd45 family protein [Candidatus Woesearchaeota archaeon]|nr:ribosomal L7Ae/L30e/S12e/Gadd45 family protein [Candidatus Woesearchaeota archaeon]
MEKLRNDLLESSEKLVFGTERNLKLLKNDGLKRIYFSSNCADKIKMDIKHYGKSVEIVELNNVNNEIGVICKKPFSISVIGLIK